MFDILKITNAIIRRVSTWLGCACCFEEDQTEQVVVHEKTCNKTNKDIEIDEENVNVFELPQFMIFRWPLNENVSDSTDILLETCRQLEKEQIVNRNNIKAPIKPPRKKCLAEASKCISTDNKFMNDSLCEITGHRLACSTEKVVPAIIVTSARYSSDCLPASSRSQSISKRTQFLTSSTTSSQRKLPKSSCSSVQPTNSGSGSYMNLPTPSKHMINIHQSKNIRKRKNISTSTKIGSTFDMRKPSLNIKLRKYIVSLFYKKIPKVREDSKN